MSLLNDFDIIVKALGYRSACSYFCSFISDGKNITDFHAHLIDEFRIYCGYIAVYKAFRPCIQGRDLDKEKAKLKMIRKAQENGFDNVLTYVKSLKKLGVVETARQLDIAVSEAKKVLTEYSIRDVSKEKELKLSPYDFRYKAVKTRWMREAKQRGFKDVRQLMRGLKREKRTKAGMARELKLTLPGLYKVLKRLQLKL